MVGQALYSHWYFHLVSCVLWLQIMWPNYAPVIQSYLKMFHADCLHVQVTVLKSCFEDPLNAVEPQSSTCVGQTLDFETWSKNGTIETFRYTKKEWSSWPLNFTLEANPILLYLVCTWPYFFVDRMSAARNKGWKPSCTNHEEGINNGMRWTRKQQFTIMVTLDNASNDC